MEPETSSGRAPVRRHRNRYPLVFLDRFPQCKVHECASVCGGLSVFAEIRFSDAMIAKLSRQSERDGVRGCRVVYLPRGVRISLENENKLFGFSIQHV